MHMGIGFSANVAASGPVVRGEGSNDAAKCNCEKRGKRPFLQQLYTLFSGQAHSSGARPETQPVLHKRDGPEGFQGRC